MPLVRIDQLGAGPSETRWDAEYYASPYRDYIAEALGAWKKWRPLGEAATKLTSGHTPRGHDMECGDCDFVTVECVSPLRMHTQIFKAVPQETIDGELSRVKLGEGDVVITIKRRIVDAAVVGGLRRPTAVNQDVAVLTPNGDYLPEFVAAFLVSRLGKFQAFRNQTEQMNPYISVGSLGELLIPVIDKDEQEPIAALVRERAAHLSQAEQLLEAADAAMSAGLGLDRLNVAQQQCYTRRFSELKIADRFDAEYFNPRYQRIMKKLRAGGRTLGDVAPLSFRPFDRRSRPTDSCQSG